MPSYGFGNHHQTEAIPGALPLKQNSPQQLAQGLFAEQISGAAFNRARHANLHSWVYRQHPSVTHQAYAPCSFSPMKPLEPIQAPNPFRWSPFPTLASLTTFLEGLHHIAQTPLAHFYLFQGHQAMQKQYLNFYDGELIFMPYQGQCILHTEFGPLSIKPGQLAVIPRGVFFRIEFESQTLGYVCENKGQPLTLPELGLMGANALANPRHFIYPDAAFESGDEPVRLYCKYQDHFFEASAAHSPLNVVAWHGNLAPYSYDLTLFNTLNSVSFDHPDPSIFTVLTSPSCHQDIPQLDLVVFPPRWLVTEHTFRPPYYHRNVMSELMGLIWGQYDAKQSGFDPGSISIHNAYTPHGPDTATYKLACKDPLKPTYLDNTLAFMFESREPWSITQFAMTHAARQHNYSDCWQTL
ncbi:MAG: homogentisate 1,2-dioxygenase [Gammaproteobacteria bacterium]|nr:homogentisate 1,2-dioxygenase [Gammaproteobacteria bacterium]